MYNYQVWLFATTKFFLYSYVALPVPVEFRKARVFTPAHLSVLITRKCHMGWYLSPQTSLRSQFKLHLRHCPSYLFKHPGGNAVNKNKKLNRRSLRFRPTWTPLVKVHLQMNICTRWVMPALHINTLSRSSIFSHVVQCLSVNVGNMSESNQI